MASASQQSDPHKRIQELEEELAGERKVTARLLEEINKLRDEIVKLRESKRKATEAEERPGTRNIATRNSAIFRDGTAVGSSRGLDTPGKQGIVAEHVEREDVMKYQIRYIAKDAETKQNLESAIRKNAMLGRLDNQQITDLVNSMELRYFKTGEAIIEQGTVGDELYISSSGTYEAKVNGFQTNSFGGWVVFGELALLYGCQRTASVVLTGAGADGRAAVWCTDRATFQMIMMKTGMMRQQQSLTFLKNIPFFAHMKDKDAELLRLVDSLTEERYEPGEYIVRQGTIGESFYVVQTGELEVLQRVNNSEEMKVLNKLHAGDTFGERALQGDDVRTASVVALSDVVLLVLHSSMFRRILHLSTNTTGPVVPQSCFYDDAGLPPLPVPADSDDKEYQNLKASDFKIIGKLGSGAFGKVDLVYRGKDKTRTYALKCLSKTHIVERKQQAHVFGERDIQKSLKHPYITRMYGTFRDSYYLYMLTEACLGGEMWCVLRQCGRLTQAEARFIVGSVVEALAYLHRHHIVYRDLKPENLMLDHLGYCKLIDFGFAKRLVGPAYKTWTFCGTPEYMAPEIILNKGHSFTTDIWAVGILIFELLSGLPPFMADEPMGTYKKVLGGFCKLPPFPANEFPKDAMALVKELCTPRPTDRLGARVGETIGIGAIRSHKWFAKFNWVSLREQTMRPFIVPQLNGPTDITNFDQSHKGRERTAKADDSGWDEGF